MNRDELKAALTELGVPFAGNASNAVLQALYDDAMVRKAAGESSPAPAPQGAVPVATAESGAGPVAAVPVVEPGKSPDVQVPVAEPVVPPVTMPAAEVEVDDVSWRVRAGLTLDQAQECARRQAEEDAANAAKAAAANTES